MGKMDAEEELDVDDDDVWDEGNRFKETTKRGPTLASCGSEEQFWTAMEKLEQAEERKGKRKFGKFADAVRSYLNICSDPNLIPIAQLSVHHNSFRKASELSDKRPKAEKSSPSSGWASASELVQSLIFVSVPPQQLNPISVLVEEKPRAGQIANSQSHSKDRRASSINSPRIHQKSWGLF